MILIPPTHTRLVKHWLFLSISALALAGLYAILLVAARSPVVQDMIPWQDTFHTALTIHVNLSVTVWFLAFAATIWVICQPEVSRLDDIFFWLAAGSILLCVISPFIQQGEALLNNYIPILDTPVFIASILIFLWVIALQAIRFLLRARSHLLVATTALLYLIAMIALIWSYVHLRQPDFDLNPAQFYELLFWGSGHILQFLYVQLMLLAWLWLAQHVGFQLASPKIFYGLFWANTLAGCLSLTIYIFYSADDPLHREAFTHSMRYLGGIAPLGIGAMIMLWLTTHWHTSGQSPYRWMLIWSVIMFAAGGILGFTIHGINTVIPAHYHGSIVGVTLALMGAVCHLLRTVGFSPVRPLFLTLQPSLYGIGQLMHIGGLAWSGGYGALRKTPGAMESLEGQIAMGLMGLGGLFSILGGLIFVVICIYSMSGNKH